MLGPTEPQDVIYVLSDGGDNASKMNAGKLQLAALSAGIRLYGILPLGISPATPEEEIGPKELAELAEETGGVAIPYYDLLGNSIERQQQRLALVKALLALPVESYRLEIQLAEEPDKRRGWNLEVVDKIKGGVRIFYPHDLLPCPAVTQKN
jgi:hypothetical protein